MNYNLTQYGYHFISAYALMSLYDQFVEGRQFSSKYVMYDSATFALSGMGAVFLKEVVEGIMPSMPGSFQSMVYKPLIHGLIYMYLYKMMVEPNELGGENYRSNKMNFVVGFVGEVLTRYIESPLVGFFTGISSI